MLFDYIGLKLLEKMLKNRKEGSLRGDILLG